MNRKVANFHKKISCHTQSSHSILWNLSIKHIFVVSMKPTETISLQIWNQNCWTMGLNVKLKKQKKTKKQKTKTNKQTKKHIKSEQSTCTSNFVLFCFVF